MNAARMDRRSLLSGVATAFFAVVASPATATAANDDVFEEFAKEIQKGGWPLAPSPLPTSVKSASELTSPTTIFQESTTGTAAAAAQEGLNAMSDLEKALQESSKKKQVGPRTHG
eukprot:CAMPEP_0119014834 /NCGR_PEP_ID=MMETSP1176-20130426/10413_1 /TAXON_ID=265551 /ORGANISM="Synedropsis recta cf, Strain CCMP1620" /LENGTH=114 /DNA_ID=CAMNT_0006968079 /DNA_START=141 /DNA_END=485 /DNA_ORIENTATION=-